MANTAEVFKNPTQPASPMNYSNGGAPDSTEASLLNTLNWHMSVEGVYAVDIDHVKAGDPVYAAFDGTLHYINPGGLGNHAFYIDSGTGYYAVYGHTQTRIPADGAKVKGGDPIANIGTEGNSTGPHLHFSVVNVLADVFWGGQRKSLTVQTPQQSLVYHFVKTHDVPKVDPNLIIVDNSLGTAGQTGATWRNQQPRNVISIVPERIAFVYDNKINPDHWDLVWPTHESNFGGIHSNIEVPQDGVLQKILILNHANNVLAEQKIDMELDEGDLINLDYSYSIQRYAPCSELPADPKAWKHEAAFILHHMTNHTLDWEDGHEGQGSYGNKDYKKKKEGQGSGASSTTMLSSIFGTGAISGTAGGALDGGKNLNPVESEVLKYLSELLPPALATKNIISGIMGNIQQESTFIPARKQDGGDSAGLFQWRADRLAALFRFAGVSRIEDVSVRKQVEFAINEFKGILQTHPLLPTASIDEATEWWNDYWEISGDRKNRPDLLQRRKQYAHRYFDNISEKQPEPEVQETPGTAYTGNFIRR